MELNGWWRVLIIKHMSKVAMGVVHKVPNDLKEILISSDKVLGIWNGLTPLARNEWICWVISVKKQITRDQHVARVYKDLLNGKRRPCCWMGCEHRTLNSK